MPVDLNAFRLLVFDWDGTLMDSIGTIAACTRAPRERSRCVRSAAFSRAAFRSLSSRSSWRICSKLRLSVI